MFACALVGAIAPGALAADRVLVMDRGGHVHARADRALPASDPALAAPPARAATARAAPKRRAPTFRGELKRLFTTGQIDSVTYAESRRSFDRTLSTARRLRGARRVELLGVIANLHDIAARGALTASRLPALLTTLERNREWWTTGRLLSYSQRVEFSGSELVWEYYPGEGIELHVLGTFGKANGLWQAHEDAQAARAARRNGRAGRAARLRARVGVRLRLRRRHAAMDERAVAGDGHPGARARVRAARRTDVPRRRQARADALPAAAAARRARAHPAGGALPDLLVRAEPDRRQRLRADARRAARLPAHRARPDRRPALPRRRPAGAPSTCPPPTPAPGRSTSSAAWSSTLPYHELLRDFLRNLCDRTGVAVYCDTAQRFTQDLRDPPALDAADASRARALARARALPPVEGLARRDDDPRRRRRRSSARARPSRRATTPTPGTCPVAGSTTSR